MVQQLSEVTSEELQRIRAASINVTAIDRDIVLRKLQRIGFSNERAIQIASANEPQFRVYGSKSPGAIPQAARQEAAKEVGLPSTATPQQIIKAGGSPYGYQSIAPTGEIISGTKDYVESKLQQSYSQSYGPQKLSLQQRYAELQQHPEQQEVKEDRTYTYTTSSGQEKSFNVGAGEKIFYNPKTETITSGVSAPSGAYQIDLAGQRLFSIGESEDTYTAPEVVSILESAPPSIGKTAYKLSPSITGSDPFGIRRVAYSIADIGLLCKSILTGKGLGDYQA